MAERRVPRCDAQNVLVCPGIHSALVALVSLFARPGGTICLDTLAYPGIKAIAAQLGVRLQALPRDDEGPLAHAFEALCKTDKPSAFYCNPTLQNPSTLTLTHKRREALADVALRYSVPIIEDDAYAMLPQSAPDALASFAPELTYYVTGLSKSLGAGLRVAHLHAPTPRQTQRLAGALRATTVMASPFTVTLATQWIVDGTALDMLNAIRNESRARQAIASRMLEAWPYEAHRGWLSFVVAGAGRKRLECVRTRIATAQPGHRRRCRSGVFHRRQSAERNARVPRWLKDARRMRRGTAHRGRDTRPSASSAFSGDVKPSVRIGI